MRRPVAVAASVVAVALGAVVLNLTDASAGRRERRLDRAAVAAVPAGGQRHAQGVPAGGGHPVDVQGDRAQRPGQTASGYLAGLGKCTVDPRFIPWGTRFRVDGYGWRYAADIGPWIQGKIVDVWLPGSEADQWGVQSRMITIG